VDNAQSSGRSFSAEDDGTGPGLPILVARPEQEHGNGLVVVPRDDALPDIAYAGPLTGIDPGEVVQVVPGAWRCPLLPEHAAGWFGRPGLSGHRLRATGPEATGQQATGPQTTAPQAAAPPATDPDAAHPAAGRDWSPRFRPVRLTHEPERALIEAADPAAGLALATEIEAVPGGAIRCRHTLTNTGRAPYVVNSLEVVFPLPGDIGETLDFTGRATGEREPQRRPVTDGLWLRAGRRGRTGHDSPTVLVAGPPGFDFGRGRVWGLHVAWSGNTIYFLERNASGQVTLGGGELLLPGEIALARGESYATPWIYLAAAGDGLDGLAAQFHGYLRALPAHPASPRPVNLNVWEAVYFDHDLARLMSLADLAAEVGVERFVLDDGWFKGRRNDSAGLGDWWVDEDVWPGGLHRIVDYVRDRGLQFGLWFEPEMVNPDSDLYRAHPDWILATGDRIPPLQRGQLVLDLTRPEVSAYLLERLDAILTEYQISYVKWDHNRDLVDAGSTARDGAPAVHGQTLAAYALLDELRRRHPAVEWESCAGGGGRIDLGILERTERVWVSDMTDALARQSIQRWTVQLVAPEYCGAHVSAPFAHQTGRFMPLSLRCATALFGHFGIEWDLTAADEASLAELSDWIRLYKRYRGLIHSGRVTRVDTPDDTAWMHGVVAADRAAALMCYVQRDVRAASRPMALTIPGLDPDRPYLITDVTPGAGPRRLDRRTVTGAALAEIGLGIPPRRPLTAIVLAVEPA
jgi:alpha-galactosidase